MILATISLVMMFSAPQADQIDRFDNANFAYVQCLFGTVRNADPGHSAPQLHQLLSASCEAERAELRASFVAVRQARGANEADAVHEWQALDQQQRQNVVAARVQAARGY